jgi:hypothetical protein
VNSRALFEWPEIECRKVVGETGFDFCQRNCFGMLADQSSKRRLKTSLTPLLVLDKSM